MMDLSDEGLRKKAEAVVTAPGLFSVEARSPVDEKSARLATLLMNSALSQPVCAAFVEIRDEARRQALEEAAETVEGQDREAKRFQAAGAIRSLKARPAPPQCICWHAYHPVRPCPCCGMDTSVPHSHPEDSGVGRAGS